MQSTAVVAAAIAACAGLVAAADFVVDPAQSSVTGALVVSADTSGTLIGDFDELNNPTGTQTRPGLFGGSGNNPIPVTIDVESQTALASVPAGSFAFTADLDNSLFTLEAYSVDLLNGQIAGSSLGLTLLFDTFRTVNPSSLYPGIPLPIDLEAGSIDTFTIVQSGPADAPGVLVPTADPAVFGLVGAIPAQLTIGGETFGGAPIEPVPADIVLPIAGTLTLNGDGSSTVVFSLDLDEFSQPVDTSAFPPLPDIPFELPTLTGETAGVILTLTLDALAFQGSGGVTLTATAAAVGCNAADLAEPFGVLDLADLSAFVTAFVAQDNAGDVNNDGLFDLADIQLYVTAFLSGCP